MAGMRVVVVKSTDDGSVDLEDLREKELTPEVVREAADRILAAITAQLEEIRGEHAPAERYDMRVSGDPYKNRHTSDRKKSDRKKSDRKKSDRKTSDRKDEDRKSA